MFWFHCNNKKPSIRQLFPLHWTELNFLPQLLRPKQSKWKQSLGSAVWNPCNVNRKNPTAFRSLAKFRHVAELNQNLLRAYTSFSCCFCAIMADANSYSGDECTDDEEDGEELDPRVQVSLNFETDTSLVVATCIMELMLTRSVYNFVNGTLTSQKFCNFTSHRTSLKDSTSLPTL